MQRILHSPLGDPEEQYALQSFYQWSSLFPKELMVPFQEERIIFEPCLKHAALALGMTHQFYRKGWLSNSQHVFAMRQYGKALNSLMLRTTASTSDNIAISLLSNPIFSFINYIPRNIPREVLGVDYIRALVAIYNTVLKVYSTRA